MLPKGPPASRFCALLRSDTVADANDTVEVNPEETLVRPATIPTEDFPMTNYYLIGGVFLAGIALILLIEVASRLTQPDANAPVQIFSEK